MLSEKYTEVSNTLLCMHILSVIDGKAVTVFQCVSNAHTAAQREGLAKDC